MYSRSQYRTMYLRMSGTPPKAEEHARDRGRIDAARSGALSRRDVICPRRPTRQTRGSGLGEHEPTGDTTGHRRLAAMTIISRFQLCLQSARMSGIRSCAGWDSACHASCWSRSCPSHTWDMDAGRLAYGLGQWVETRAPDPPSLEFKQFTPGGRAKLFNIAHLEPPSWAGRARWPGGSLRPLERLGTAAHLARATQRTIAAPVAMSGIPLLSVIRSRVVGLMDGHTGALAGRSLGHLIRLRLRESGKGRRRLIWKIAELRSVALSRERNKSGSRRRHVRGKPGIWVGRGLGEIKQEKRKAADYRQDRTENQEHGQHRLVDLGFQRFDHKPKRGTTD